MNDEPRSDARARYAEMILAQAPRVLGCMDRERFSSTAGCCDRTFWAWKFVDFPRSRFQEALCVLSFLFREPVEGSPYCGNPRLLEWIEAGLRYWSSLQHDDGSFDEAYPFERSLAATAFTSFYVAEALEFAGDALDSGVREQTAAALGRAADWLACNDESHGILSNHLAAAAAASYHAFRLCGEARFERRSRHFLDRILRHQSEEGWYEEYGGADPGYQTHGTFYLARLWQLSGKDEALLASLRRSTAFLSHFVHPDGSLGGEYTSRNTQTYYPAAFEMLSAVDGRSAWIAQAMRPSIATGQAAGLVGIDPFNLYPCLNNLVFAHEACKEPGAPAVEAPTATEPLLWFPQAGLARIRHPRYEAFVGTSKGGVIKIFDRRRQSLCYSDCGYVGKTLGGKLVSTQQLDPTAEVSISPERFEIHGGLHEVSRPTMKPHTFTAFRLFSLTVGRIAGVARWLKRLLVRVLISPRRPLAASFVRVIELGPDEVTISDTLQSDVRLAFLEWEESFTTIHMGSSRYFIPQELVERSAVDDRSVGPEELAKGATRRRTVRFD